MPLAMPSKGDIVVGSWSRTGTRAGVSGLSKLVNLVLEGPSG